MKESMMDSFLIKFVKTKCQADISSLDFDVEGERIAIMTSQGIFAINDIDTDENLFTKNFGKKCKAPHKMNYANK